MQPRHTVGFVNALDLRAYAPGEWVVLNDLDYQPKHGYLITVPQSFITDLASIPAPLRGILNVNGRSRMPAVLHDFLYSVQPKGFTRKRSDALFYEALVSVGVHPAIARLYWAGVRLGGWLYWNKRVRGTTIDDFVPPFYWENQ
jgi:hypothetical protein